MGARGGWLTRSGWATLVGSIGLTWVGFVLDYLALEAIGVAGILALLSALPWTLRRPNLAVSRRVRPERVMVGEDASALLSVTNRSSRRLSSAVAVDQIAGRPTLVRVGTLDPTRTARLAIRLPTDRRAMVRLGPLAVRRSDPFGLTNRTEDYGDTAVLWVHPRRHALRPLPGSRIRSLEGPASDRAPQGTLTFHALREYAPGDDLRLVHWRSTARTGRLMIRQHIDTSLPDVTVVVDDRRGAHTPDSFEYAIEAAASVLHAAVTQGFPARLLTLGGVSVESRQGTTETTPFLDRLAALELSDEATFAGWRTRALSLTRGYSVTVLAGALSDEDRHAIVGLRANFDQMTVALFAPDAEAVGFPSATVIVAATAERFADAWNRLM